MEQQPEEQRPDNKESFWTPESVRDLENFLDKLLDKWITYKKGEAEAENKYLQAITKHSRNIFVALIAFLIAIIGLMSYLTLSGKVSGDALLFLVGTVTGYVIIFIQRLIFDTDAEPPT
ncbi:MAG: hypothetical protein Q8O41_10555 [Candidatus Methanoperedens sp.]|nr:hypothetical protein [Candidatus Methanoperedens sp.]